MPYLPIEDYGLIGNMHTAALVGRDGSIDWLCLPHFDSPSVFAALLDQHQGGFFRIAPAVEGLVTRKQVYWPETNVLITRFLLEEGVVEVVDYMPVGLRPGDAGFRQLIRKVEAIRGSVPVRVECYPAFNYARDTHQARLTEAGAVFHSPGLTLELNTRVPLEVRQGPRADSDPGRPGVEALVPLRQGERCVFVLRQLDEKHQGAAVLADAHEQELFHRTVAFWRRWLGQCTYSGRWREMVHRSALALKLLTFEPTGALVAAPTTSLPEHVGGGRNWDYRYTWVRDTNFTLYAMLRIGFAEEAGAFMGWLEQRCHQRNPDGGLQIMYGLRGEKQLTEITLDHLEGYRGSRPVRVGNAAHDQLQLDIYGEFMDSAWVYNKHGEPISWDLWVQARGLVDWVCDHWQQADDGIWETRGGRQHFVYSKFMCWVAVDRGIRLADARGFPADRAKWYRCRDEIYPQIMDRGWDPRRKAFVQHYGGDALDASNLVMTMMNFLSATDPRMLSTLDAICQDPKAGGLLSDSLVYRYNREEFSDGLAGGEGTFNICTFWLVDALTRAGRRDRGRLDQARLIFEKMLGYANHLGLYAEQTGTHGEALGNFPQAFTHLSLITAAFHLDWALGKRHG